jgi:hypothetical protein
MGRDADRVAGLTAYGVNRARSQLRRCGSLESFHDLQRRQHHDVQEFAMARQYADLEHAAGLLSELRVVFESWRVRRYVEQLKFVVELFEQFKLIQLQQFVLQLKFV